MTSAKILGMVLPAAMPLVSFGLCGSGGAARCPFLQKSGEDRVGEVAG